MKTVLDSSTQMSTEPDQIHDPSRELSPHHAPSPSIQAMMSQMTERMQLVIDAAERAAEAIRYDAEEQAARHLAEAQRKADRLTAERIGMIAELTDDLLFHAGQVREHSEQMVKSLEDAIESVSGKLEVAMPPEPTHLEGGVGSGGPERPPAPLEESPVHPPMPPEVAPEPFEPLEVEPPPPEPPPYEAEIAAAPETQPEPEPAPLPAPPSDPSPVRTLRGTPISQEALLHATRLAVAGNEREEIATTLRDDFGIEDPDPVLDRVLGAE